MAASASTRLLLLSSIVASVHAHGSTSAPKPRNAEPASKGYIAYGVTFTANASTVVMATHNQHLCPAGGGYQTESYPADVCVPNPVTQSRPTYRFGATAPTAPGRLVDCAANENNCTAAAATESRDETGDFVYVTQYPPFSDCSEPVVTYKIRQRECAQLPVTGDDYWTGGCAGYSCQWFSQGCAAGCNCTGDPLVDHCDAATAPTLPHEFRTFNVDGRDPEDWTRTHPWRSPGKADVFDACGVAGGAFKDNTKPGGHPPPGHEWGDRGSELPAGEPVETWSRGATVNVSWGIAANHGGGFAYRLCPADEPLTEACFRAHHLDVGSKQVLRLGNGSEVAMAAQIVTSDGAPWIRNPIPACHLKSSGNGECGAPQFPPPPGCDETCWGSSDNHTLGLVLPVIVNEVVVPAELPAGRYVLGFRWDCEGTSQIWASCSDVALV